MATPEAPFTSHELVWTELVDPVTPNAFKWVIRKVQRQRHNLFRDDWLKTLQQTRWSLSSDHYVLELVNCSYCAVGVFPLVCTSLSPYSHTFIIGIPSPTHSFTLGLNPSFSANPPYRSLSFLSFKIHYMDFPDCLLLLLSISVFFTFLFKKKCFYTF